MVKPKISADQMLICAISVITTMWTLFYLELEHPVIRQAVKEVCE